MKKYILIAAMLYIISRSVSLSAATPLTPPTLQNVMQKNEVLTKENIKRIPVTKRVSTGTVASKTISYQTYATGKSVILSRANEIDLWVQEIHLGSGSYIESKLIPGGYDEITGEPLFQKETLSNVQNSTKNNPFSIINGQFFDPVRKNTPLSFGVKVDGIVRTAGADNRDESKNILIISSTGAQIVPYSWDNLRDANGYLAMVNLTLDTPQQKNESIGRTYICLKTPDTNNTSSTLIVFTALAMTESSLEKELPRWGCTRRGTSKLDASGSTRLWTQGEYIYGKSRKGDPDYRKIPHYLVVWDR